MGAAVEAVVAEKDIVVDTVVFVVDVVEVMTVVFASSTGSVDSRSDYEVDDDPKV